MLYYFFFFVKCKLFSALMNFFPSFYNLHFQQIKCILVITANYKIDTDDLFPHMSYACKYKLLCF